MAEKLSAQASFRRKLFFTFSVELSLPEKLGFAMDKRPPRLTHMALEWPVTMSHRTVELSVNGTKWPLAYNPEKRALEWGDIPLKAPREKDKGTNLFTYKTPEIQLEVVRPGELYQLDRLCGHLEITIPRSVSGLEMKVFTVGGYDSGRPTEANSLLKADVTLFLEDLFDGKIFSPYQHLQFDGVILDSMRLNDILNLLRDQGFEPVDARYGEPKEIKDSYRSDMFKYVIGRKRREGPGELKLWLLVEGTHSQTQRRKEIPGGETFTSQLQTGRMKIYMRGQLQNDKARLMTVMNEIHTLLKERFRHVSTME
jgi:hypothetical protein